MVSSYLYVREGMTSVLNTNIARVKVKERISELTLRKYCDDLFRYIESLPEDNVIVDFEGFTECSRAFAHQYLMNKQKSSKKSIKEVNMSTSILKTFDDARWMLEKGRYGWFTAIRAENINTINK
jgi:hypothetical protein